ncbi:MAG TPA: response regulator transcription factor [Acidobacteriaceae bacterium]|nr:response regulator transcription factor [Acidobacteriaceae bacterium]
MSESPVAFPPVPFPVGLPATERLRILVADDHLVYRIGIRSLLEAEMGLQVVGEAANSTETIELYRKLRPDVLLLDLRMPHKGGIEAVRAIRGEFPEARVLVVTSYQTEEEVLQVLQAGALGYILKDLDGSMLMQAIQAVCAGKRWISPGLERQLAEGVGHQPLTARELEVLRLLARGLTNREIASVFHISESTVKNHVNHLLGKLEVADRTEAVSFCLARGIVRIEDL